MKKSTLISLAALAVAVVGVLIALAAYFKKKNDTLIDDFDDELLYDDLEDDTEYYEAHLDDEDDLYFEGSLDDTAEEFEEFAEDCCNGDCEHCAGCVEIEEEEEPQA